MTSTRQLQARPVTPSRDTAARLALRAGDDRSARVWLVAHGMSAPAQFRTRRAVPGMPVRVR